MRYAHRGCTRTDCPNNCALTANRAGMPRTSGLRMTRAAHRILTVDGNAMARNHILLGLVTTLGLLVGCDATDKAETPAPAPEKPKDAPKPVEGKRTPV